MAGKSNYLEDGVLNHVFRGVAFPTIPAAIYVALYTATPTDAGGGTEVSGGAYARVSITRATGAFAAPADNAGSQQTSNSATVVFPSPTAAWGTVTHFAIMDAATAGNQLYWGVLSVSRNVLSGDVSPQFAIGALQISED